MRYSDTYHPSAWGAGICVCFLGPTVAVVSRDTYIFGELIPKGYVTDGGSIPARLCGFMRRFGKGLPAFLIHDRDYDPVADDGIKVRRYTRKEADDRLYTNLRKCGVGPFRARIAYRAVRLGGRKPWDAGTKTGTVNV